jgi:hypothetical protein
MIVESLNRFEPEAARVLVLFNLKIRSWELGLIGLTERSWYEVMLA